MAKIGNKADNTMAKIVGKMRRFMGERIKPVK